jgi:hypothetical protein
MEGGVGQKGREGREVSTCFLGLVVPCLPEVQACCWDELCLLTLVMSWLSSSVANVSQCTDTCEQDPRGFCERDILVNETQLTCLP